MTKINILRFTHYTQRSFLRFLRQQPAPGFSISIPKRKTPADGADDMFEEYFTATYVGQLLYRASEDLSYVLPDPATTGSFCYLVKPKSLYALSKALFYIAGGFSEDSDRAEAFYQDIWSFIDRMDDHECIACGDYFETANVWANTIAAEYEARNGRPKEERIAAPLAQNSATVPAPDSEGTHPQPAEAQPDTPPVSRCEAPTASLIPPTSGFFMPASDESPLITLHLPEFVGYDEGAILHYLQLQETNRFRLLVPKRTALGHSAHVEVAGEYTAVAYIAHRLHQEGARYTLDYPALNRTGDFVFEGQTDNWPALAALLHMLVCSYGSSNPDTSDLYIQSLYMLARTPRADIHSTDATDCLAIALQFWNMHSIECEEQNPFPGEEDDERE